MSAARKSWTAAVCSMFLSSWRVRLPVTFAPLQRTFGVFRGNAPPPPRHGDGGAVPAGQ